MGWGGRRTGGFAQLGRLFVVMSVGLVCMFALAGVASAQSFTVQTLDFHVTVGPEGARQGCTIVGDLYRPADATAAHPDPAVLTTNGFGGSKDSQMEFGEELASDGYVVLSYSGLGFGGSGCPIELDDPDWDGEAASQLVTFLGGGMAATNGTTVNYVIHDAVASNGQHYAYDPRVGMLGGSYGGEVQFAAAEQDPRIDTIVPLITWNNLSYSLAPNNANLPADSVTGGEPGSAKDIWLNFFFADGAAVGGLQQLQTDPTADLTGCPNFPAPLCAEAVSTDASGAPPSAAIAQFEHASVESYMSNIRVPVLLAQGEDDTLFQLREAVSTYQSLRAQHIPVKMIWQSWGHSQGVPAPGELGDINGQYALDDANGHATYEGTAIRQWFDHYLKDAPAAPSLDFSFFRPWVSDTGDAAAAYGRAPSYPVGQDQPLYLSGAGSLVDNPSQVAAGTSTFLTTGLGSPTSYSEISAIEQNTEPGQAPYDLPGTDAEYVTPPLTADTDVIGLPSVTGVRVSAPGQSLSGNVGPSGDLVLFFKLYDLSPSGAITLPDKLIAPVRVPADGAPFTVALPGIVHRFAAGDRIALVIAGGDQAYRGNLVGGPVSVSVDPAADTVLHLPVAPASAYGGVVPATAPRHCNAPTGRLSSRAIGRAGLGLTRATIRRRFSRISARGRRDMQFLCLDPRGIRVGYASAGLLAHLSPRQRHGLAGRVVLALTADPFYALHAVRPGTMLSAVARRLRVSRAYHVGLNFWYFVPDGDGTGLLKVRGGVIQEIGVVNRSLTRTTADRRRFLRSFA